MRYLLLTLTVLSLMGLPLPLAAATPAPPQNEHQQFLFEAEYVVCTLGDTCERLTRKLEKVVNKSSADKAGNAVMDSIRSEDFNNKLKYSIQFGTNKYFQKSFKKAMRDSNLPQQRKNEIAQRITDRLQKIAAFCYKSGELASKHNCYGSTVLAEALEIIFARYSRR